MAPATLGACACAISLFSPSSFSLWATPVPRMPTLLWEQREQHWIDDRWSKTDIGGFLAGTLPLPNGTVKKGLAIRVGDKGEAAVGLRHGAVQLARGMDGRLPEIRRRALRPHERAEAGGCDTLYRIGRVDGRRRAMARDARQRPARGARLHRRRRRACWRAVVCGRDIHPRHPPSRRTRGNCAWASRRRSGAASGGAGGAQFMVENGKRRARFRPRTPRLARAVVARLRAGALTLAEAPQSPQRPGAPRWQPLTTRGISTSADAYVVDTLTVPYDNPWKALMFASGVDFLPNGDAARLHHSRRRVARERH